MSIQIESCYIKKYEEDSDVPISDVECKVICLAQNSMGFKTADVEESSTYTVAYCVNPMTGEIANCKLEHIIVKTLYDTSTKEFIDILCPNRVESEGASD